jgi:hypothetical protein
MARDVLDETDEGKLVVDASGKPVGTIASVAEDEPQFGIEPDPGMADRLAERFGWDTAADVYPLHIDRITTVTKGYVQLAGAY